MKILYFGPIDISGEEVAAKAIASIVPGCSVEQVSLSGDLGEDIDLALNMIEEHEPDLLIGFQYGGCIADYIPFNKKILFNPELVINSRMEEKARQMYIKMDKIITDEKNNNRIRPRRGSSQRQFHGEDPQVLKEMAHEMVIDIKDFYDSLLEKNKKTEGGAIYHFITYKELQGKNLNAPSLEAALPLCLKKLEEIENQGLTGVPVCANDYSLPFMEKLEEEPEPMPVEEQKDNEFYISTLSLYYSRECSGSRKDEIKCFLSSLEDGSIQLSRTKCEDCGKFTIGFTFSNIHSLCGNAGPMLFCPHCLTQMRSYKLLIS